MSAMSRAFQLDLASLRASLARKQEGDEIEHTGARAAVSMVLRERDERVGAEVLLIQRAEHPSDPWSGHMAFPGGRKDESDASVRATAEREALEEVGLDLSRHAELLWRMPDLQAIGRGRRMGMVITPLVYALGRTHDGEALSFDASEVASALWVPLGFLADSANHSTMSYTYEGKSIQLPCVRLEGERVLWGLTLQMLSTFFDALG
jgi:8-oxo-dGTP pyrophosphatase MutT (NUDIX family)